MTGRKKYLASETKKRQKAERLGRAAENFASLFLRLKGYHILAQRFRSPMGEIDLIARKGEIVILIEVKARKTSHEAIAAVSPAARIRIARAGSLFLSRNNAYADLGLRYDIIAVTGWRIKHIRDAWRDGDP